MLPTEPIASAPRAAAPADALPQVKFRSSCDACLSTKVKCSQTKQSCARCIQHGRQCVYSQYRKVGRPSAKAMGDTDRKSKKPSQKWQAPQTPTQAQSQARQKHRKHSLQSQNVPGGHIMSTPSCSQTGQDLEDLDQENSALMGGDSALALDQNMPDPDLANFTDGSDYGVGGVDWSALESLFDASAAMPLAANQEQIFSSHRPYHGNEPHLDGILAGNMSPSSHNSRESPSAGLHYRSCPPPAPRVERLFSSYFDYPSSAENSSFMAEPPHFMPQAGLALNPISSSSSKAAFSRARESNLFSVSSSRCTLQCHVNLTNQLTNINDFQSKDAGTSLDVLLNLDSHIRKERDKVLRCPFCLASPGCAQTVMLITMVVGNLLGLFEHSCGTSDTDGGSGIVNGSIGTGAPLPTSKIPLWTSTRNPLPYTTRHLTVGDIQLDEAVKRAFSRRLTRMYLDQQIKVVHQLKELLGRGDEGNISFQVTKELLADIFRRLEYFIGFITLTDNLEIYTA